MARAKKAPVVKSVILDNAPNTYRAINRMNGIVTMIEHTSEDNIKAYELEPTYRELGGGGGGTLYKTVFGPITQEIEPDEEGHYIINNYDSDVLANNELFILEINMDNPIILSKEREGLLKDAANKNSIAFEGGVAAIGLDPAYGPYDYPSSYIFLYATYFQETEDDGGNE